MRNKKAFRDFRSSGSHSKAFSNQFLPNGIEEEEVISFDHK